MKFIFPQNYNFKNKILGIIDYTTAIVNVVWYVLVFLIVNFLFNSINLKIIFFIIFCFPLFLFSFAGFNGENIIVVFKYMFNFIFKPKLLFYSKIKNNPVK